MRRSCPHAPPSEYAELRARAPLAKIGSAAGRTTWLVTRQAEAREVLADPRISADSTAPGHPAARESAVRRVLIDMDGAEHGAFRRLLTPEFTLRAVRAKRTRLHSIVDTLLDGMLAEGGPRDLVRDFALPVPSLMICALLGVPYSDHEFFQSRTRIATDLDEPAASQGAALMELRASLVDLVEAKAADPGDDLISRLLAGPATRAEVASLATIVLIAGHETSASMIGLGVVTLLQRPDVLAALREGDLGWPAVVEELLRYHSIGEPVLTRVAAADLEIGGELIRAGDGVVVLGATADRDERAFDRGDEFDPYRATPRHLAFGHGAHRCVGADLARAELEIAYRALFERIPGLRLAVDAEALPFKYSSEIFGLHALPVTW
ncbi:Pentalenic acid synthase [Amycolatopsis sp. CA-230715]|nr:Pentalenic acid synthase [Amycolatopsis sp. CA-230715]